MGIYEFLAEASKAYYEGDPIIDDNQYDALEELYGQLPGVGYIDVKNEVQHYKKLYSLNKLYPDERKPDWFHTHKIYETPKLDGAAVSLLYSNGKLVLVLTRGDGEVGIDITHLFKVNGISSVHGVPSSIEDLDNRFITGEIVTVKDTKNARNYAAGALNLKDKEKFINRDLYFIAYDCFPEYNDDYLLNIVNLYDMGFELVSSVNIEEVFPTDGAVVRIASYKEFYAEGHTSKFPKGAIALKTRTDGVKTKILEVIWQTGKSGKVTPVAILEPIEIDGAVVQRATLNNMKFIEALDLNIGDYVMVERAGQIIPRIIKKAE